MLKLEVYQWYQSAAGLLIQITGTMYSGPPVNAVLLYKGNNGRTYYEDGTEYRQPNTACASPSDPIQCKLEVSREIKQPPQLGNYYITKDLTLVQIVREVKSWKADATEICYEDEDKNVYTPEQLTVDLGSTLDESRLVDALVHLREAAEVLYDLKVKIALTKRP